MKPSISIELVEGPLTAAPPSVVSGAGAVLVFEGVVRPEEAGRSLEALRYEAYEPMATRELGRLAERTVIEHGLFALGVTHSVGRVAVGQVSFRLAVAGAHRAEALAACDAFITEMKRCVPLWKTPVFRPDS